MREFTKKKYDDSILTTVLVLMLLLMAFYIIGTSFMRFDDVSREYKIELNNTKQSAFTNGTSYGVYSLAYEQTQSGNIYYLNSSGGLEYDSLKNICGRIGKW